MSAAVGFAVGVITLALNLEAFYSAIHSGRTLLALVEVPCTALSFFILRMWWQTAGLRGGWWKR